MIELFKTYEDIKDWFIDAKLIKEFENLSKETEDKYYFELIEYRDLIKNSFFEYVKDKTSFENLVEKTNTIFLNAKVHPKLQIEDTNYTLEYDIKEKNCNKLLATIAIEVMNLLNSKDAKYIKRCNNHTCSLLFVDTSKNHSRRWCSMETCGNRKKASRFSKKQKELNS